MILIKIIIKAKAEEEPKQVAAAIVEEKEFGDVRAVLDDPDLGVSKEDIINIRKA
jgi:hypothetical protein